MKLKNTVFFILLLIILNTLSHFLPFERNSLSPDDYVFLMRARTADLTDIAPYFLKYPHRPLNHYVLDVQNRFVGDNAKIGLLFVFVSTAFVLIAVFLLFQVLFKDDFLAFIGSLIYCLLPNKLEVYHNTIYFNINMAIGIYILSFLFFLYFAEQRKRIYFLLSIIFYSVGIFWYEAGFFMPIVMIVYGLLYRRKGLARYVLFFAAFAILYVVIRLTGMFGLGDMSFYPHKVGLSALPANLMELFNSYFGRYIARSILYGFYKFLSIEQPWLILIIFLNVIFIIFMAIWIKRKELGRVDGRLKVLSAVMFPIFLMPIFLNNSGGIGGRHLSLPSLSVAIFAVWVLTKFKKEWRILLLSFLTAALIVCQGNAWTQVVACRINGAIYQTLKVMKPELVKAGNVIFDTKSFANNIPFTLVDRDFNVLNTYYGAQALENWGLRGMVQLITDDMNKNVYIAVTEPERTKDGKWEFSIFKEEGYRSKIKVIKTSSMSNSLLISFKSVYGGSFNNGNLKQ